MKKLHIIILIVVLAFSSKEVKSQTPPQVVVDSLQAILNQALPSNFQNSGVIMSVYAPGQWTWSGAVGNGIAGITAQQPQTNASVSDRYRVGSITKMMVAVCILKLEQDGLLSIEDPIDMYLRPTLVNDTIAPSDTVRIRHLLNHTSGIANSADNTSCQQNVLTNPLGSHSLEEAIYCGASQGELFPPEFAWGYSNTNYSILAMIIETITGQSYSSYLTQTIITPLNLTQTEIPATNQISGPHMGCYWNIGNWIDLTIINPTTYTGWADVVSTTQDLITFYEALRNGQLIDSTLWSEMQTMYPGTFGYGLGLDFYTITSQNYVGHYGEVANTSGLFFADIHSSLCPNGYYIAYNFNVQGADMQTFIDVPVLLFLNNNVNGVTEINPSEKFQVFPNPCSDYLQIKTNDNASASITMTDLSGRTVNPAITRSSGVQLLDVSGLPRGAYILSISEGMYTETHKVILE